MVLTPASLTVDEGDTTGGSIHGQALPPVPSEQVTVTITGHTGTEVSLDKTTLTFTTTELEHTPRLSR